MEGPGNGGPGGTALVASIAGVAVQLVPEIIALVKAFHSAKDPNAPNPTDTQVLEALAEAVSSSIAKDDRWLAAHPKTD